MSGLLVLAALPLMLLGGLLLDVATLDDDPPHDKDEDAPPEISDTPDEDDPIA